MESIQYEIRIFHLKWHELGKDFKHMGIILFIWAVKNQINFILFTFEIQMRWISQYYNNPLIGL